MMTTKPTGMVALMPAGAVRWALGVLLEGRLMDGMNKFTLLGGPVWGSGNAAAGNEVGEIDRQWQLIGSRDPRGVRRCLFGVGGGPIEATAEAKQDMGIGTSQGVRISDEWVKSGSVVTC